MPSEIKPRKITEITERFDKNGAREWVYSQENERGVMEEWVSKTRERAEANLKGAKAREHSRVWDLKHPEEAERRRAIAAAEQAKKASAGHQRSNPKAGTGDPSQLAKHLGKEVGKEMREALGTYFTKPRYFEHNEPRDKVYRGQRQHSMLTDIIQAAQNDNAALGRLQAHADEMALYRSQEYTAPQNVPAEIRATSSNLGGLVPPLYLHDEIETAARRRRRLLNAIEIVEPAQVTGNESILTETSTAAVVANQSEGAVANPALTEPAWTDNKQAWRTIRSFVDVSVEGFERGALVEDTIILELAAAIEEQIEAQLFANGTVPNLSGLTTLGANRVVPAANVIDDADHASPTGTMMYKHIVDLGTVVSDSRKVAPDVVLMHPRRLNAMLKATTTASGHQLVFPNGLSAIGEARIIPSPVIPTDLGTADDQDIVYALVGSDLVLVRSPLYVFRELATPDARKAGTVRLSAGRFCALHVRHGGKGVASVTGTIFDEDSAAVES